MKRCFIALNLPSQVKARFEQIQADLRQKNSELKAVWVKAPKAHITLIFLGDLEEKRVNVLKDNLKATEGKFGPILLSLTGVGAFPSLEMPKVLFLGVKHRGENKLTDLYGQVCRILDQAEIKREKNVFMAHITLARIKESDQKINFMGEEMEDVDFEVSSFELMESVLTPEGPEYEVIQEYRL